MTVIDPTLKLEAVLAANVSTSQPEMHVVYRDYQSDGLPTIPVPARTALNNSTDVVLLAAPTGTIKVREIERLSAYNKDTTSVALTLKTDDAAASTERIILKATLLTGETLHFEKWRGFYVTDANGEIKTA